MSSIIKPENRSVVVLYVHEFIYRALPSFAHPKKDRLYRAIKSESSPDKQVYHLIFEEDEREDIVGDSMGIVMEELKADDEFWRYFMVEVDPSNLPDFDIDVEDYLKLNRWGDDFRNGIEELLESMDNPSLPPIVEPLPLELPPEEIGPIAPNDNIPEGIQEILANSIKEIRKKLAPEKVEKAIKDYKRLYVEDPNLFFALSDVITYLYSTKDEHYETGTPNLSKYLCTGSPLGRGINSFNVLKYMQRYVSEGNEKSNNPKDLNKAVHYLLYELIRRNNDKKE